MKTRIINTSLLVIGAIMSGLTSQTLMAKTSLNLDEAIQLALTNDPRIEEKRKGRLYVRRRHYSTKPKDPLACATEWTVSSP